MCVSCQQCVFAKPPGIACFPSGTWTHFTIAEYVAGFETIRDDIAATNLKAKIYENIQRYIQITVYQTAPFQSRNIWIDLVSSWEWIKQVEF